MKFKAETLAVIRKQDLVHGMSNQLFILHLVLSVSVSKGSFKATLQGTFKTPRKKTPMCESEPETIPHPGEDFDRSRAFQFCSSVEAS